jgi:hypothetical protein
MSEQKKRTYLVTRDPVALRDLEFCFNERDGSLIVDSHEFEMPFTVFPEATYALLQYLERHRDEIIAAQREMIQTAMDVKDAYPGADVWPRFELVEREPEEEPPETCPDCVGGHLCSVHEQKLRELYGG